MRLKDYLLAGKIDFYQETAESLLNKIHFNHPCEISLTDLCDIYGIKVIEVEEGLNLSIPMSNDRKGLIILEKTKDRILERERLAEEFSHVYLHQLNQITSSKVEVLKSENQAFKLAANILIPTNWLLDIEVFPYRNQMRILASDVANQFNVSVNFAYNRLKLLSQNYRFGTKPTDLFSDVIFEKVGLGYLTLPQSQKLIYVILNEKDSFVFNDSIFID